jgi:hypothetical protein
VLSERIIGILASHKEVIMEAVRIIQAALEMSDQTLKDIIQTLEQELQDRQEIELQQWGSKKTNGGILTVEDICPDLSTIGTINEDTQVTKMVHYLERHVDWETGGAKEEFLETYYNAITENNRKESMRTTGA